MLLPTLEHYRQQHPERVLQVLQALRILQQCGPIYPNMGICYNLARIRQQYFAANTRDQGVLLLCLWRDWPAYTGNTVYPVPNNDGNALHKQPWCGEQRELRHQLLEHMITKLEASYPYPIPAPLSIKQARRTYLKHAVLRAWHRWF